MMMKRILAKIGPLHVLIIGFVLSAGTGASMFFFLIKPTMREIASVTKKIESEREVARRRKSAEKALAKAKEDYERAKEEFERAVKGKFLKLPEDPDKALAVYAKAVMGLRKQLVQLATKTGNVVVSGPSGPDIDALRPPQPNDEGLVTYPPGATAGGPSGAGPMGPAGPMGAPGEMMGAMGPMGMGMGGGGTAGNAISLTLEGTFASILRFLEELKNFDYPVTVLNITLKSTGKRRRTVRAEIPLVVYLAMVAPKAKGAPAGTAGPPGVGTPGMPGMTGEMGSSGGAGPMGPGGG